MGSDSLQTVFYTVAWGIGMIGGILMGSANKVSNYTPSLEDLNGNGIKNEIVLTSSRDKLAYFPDTNGIYRLKKDFDFSSLTNLESTVEAEE